MFNKPTYVGTLGEPALRLKLFIFFNPFQKLLRMTLFSLCVCVNYFKI